MVSSEVIVDIHGCTEVIIAKEASSVKYLVIHSQVVGYSDNILAANITNSFFFFAGKSVLIKHISGKSFVAV